MKPYRRRRLPLSRFWLVLNLLCPVGIFACAGQGIELRGSWVSTDITHPSPFFSETLAVDKYKHLTLFFDEAGGFVGLDHEGICHLGTYLVQDDTLVLTEAQGEPITVGYAFLGGHRLQLKSPDGFTFEFQRASENSHTNVKPCNR